MSKPKKPPLVKLSELEPGQYADCFAQLIEKTRSTSRDGHPYYTCRFRDVKRIVLSRVWSDSPFFADCQDQWPVGQFFKLRGVYSEHDRYGAQLDLEQARLVEERDRADGFSELDFFERSRFDPEQLFGELETCAGELVDPPLRQLALTLLRDNAATLKLLPASTRHAYPFAGGWLEHTLNVVRTSLLLTDYYAKLFTELRPPLNRDLILAGALLLEIGRVKSIEVGLAGQSPQSRIAGELFGVPHLSYELIHAAAVAVPELSRELLELLLHIVVAEPRHAESSASRQPRIPEAVIVHAASDLDGALEMIMRCLIRDSGDGPFTERDAMLGRALLKGRKL
jgi:3'-5' exoribonuclease